MFGYVNVYKDELKIKEYNVYRAYYCGLCKMLGSEFSQSVRMGLSYDFSFLALVLSSVDNCTEEIKNEKCIIHPISKRPASKEEKFITYSAYMSVINTYFKLKDDVNDNKKIKSFIALMFYKRHLNKAKKKYPEEYRKIKHHLNELYKKEKEKCADTDEVADCFGKILELLFSPEFLNCDEITKKALSNFGYNLGRFIYLADAVNDIEEDIRKRNYNPVVLKFNYNGKDGAELKKSLEKNLDYSLTFTLENISKAFELIEFKKNRGIIKNIIYLGLRQSKDRALKGEK